MSKRPGRAQSVSSDRPRESVGFRRRREKRKRALAFLKGEPLIVGLDLGKKRHAAWFAKHDLTPLRRFMVNHSCEGLAKLLERVDAERLRGGHGRALFFMEATSYFWENVANYLEAKDLPYRLVSSLSVDRQRQIEYQTYAKSDYRDAELIARLGQSGQWLERQLETERLWRELRALGREHDILLEAETSERLRLRSLLGLVLPEFLDCFKDPVGKTALALIRRLTRPAHQFPETFEEIRERSREVVGTRLAKTKLRAFAARLEVGPCFGVERALAPTLVRLGLVLDRYEFLSAQRGDVRRRLVVLYETTPYHSFLDTIPGVGSESHALLLGLIGDPKRYDRATCLAKLAGIEPRENQSGNAEGSHSISRRGQPSLRHLLYRIVFGLFRANDEFRVYITRLRARDKNPMAWTQAVVAAGNKYLRIVHHICVHQEAYRPAKLRP